MQAIAAELGLLWRLAPFAGADFNDILAGLSRGSWDCVASGTTITPERQSVAAFCAPYVESGQSLVCNVKATPQVRSIDDLKGLVIGVQSGNTSEPVADRLKSQGRVADVRVYAYGAIGAMLDDLEAGRIGAVMKLAPVMRWFVRTRPLLRVVQEQITDERIAVAVGRRNEALRQAIDAAQSRLRSRGTLDGLKGKWLT
jgi:ABC-type amino acid transport substrate-binding protein